MGMIHVLGGKKLYGETTVQGSKNAALPLMAASVLHKGVTVIHNCPRIQDVECMRWLLEDLGCKTVTEDHTLIIDASVLKKSELDPQLTAQMRGSVLLMGSLLGRCKEVTLPFPGGCVIGKRPVNYHIDLMQKMGAEVIFQDNKMIFRADCLEGTVIDLPFPSVGATENGILAAVLANGKTILRGCAREPEIEELCHFLKERGARIEMSEGQICLEGVAKLEEAEYTLMPDRIVAGTYLLAACATGGKIALHHVPESGMQPLIGIIEKMGGHLITEKQRKRRNILKADCSRLRPSSLYLQTAPYPGFPTDLQSQMIAVEAAREGARCVMREEVFESRFLIVEELRRMGAHIQIDGTRACIRGTGKLHGEHLTVRDLRGGAALILAALAAEGTSQIAPDDYIKRGYENICRDLEELGARIYSEENGRKNFL